MRIAQIICAATVLGACRSERSWPEATPSAGRSELEAVRRLAGCYVLQTDSAPPYHVQIDTTRTTGAWRAHLFGPGATANHPGDEWSWSPKELSADSSFVVHWGGIDGEMKFIVRRQGKKWAADADLRTGQPNVHWHPATLVERVTCPNQGA